MWLTRETYNTACKKYVLSMGLLQSHKSLRNGMFGMKKLQQIIGCRPLVACSYRVAYTRQ